MIVIYLTARWRGAATGFISLVLSPYGHKQLDDINIFNHTGVREQYLSNSVRFCKMFKKIYDIKKFNRKVALTNYLKSILLL